MSESLESTNEQWQEKRIGGCTGKGFRPGLSGNPAGVSKSQHGTAAKLRRIAASMTAEALNETLAILRNSREPTRLRLRAAEIIVRCGHADAVKLQHPEVEGITFVVQTLAMSPEPVPGVLGSPVKEHVWRQQPKGIANSPLLP